MKIRRIVSLLIAGVMALSVTACGGSSAPAPAASAPAESAPAAAAAEGKTYNFKCGHTGAPDHHYQYILTKFAEDVKEKSGGRITIDVFPSDQLGNQMEATEGVMLGTHDMILTSDMVLSNWIPEFGILNLPFIFQDNDHLRAVLDGEIGEKLSAMVEPKGAINLGYFDNGFRHITTKDKEINTPEDVKGLKIRVPEGKVYVDTFEALGAQPTVISFGELYSALQLGTVDGQENPPAHIVTQKFYEVQKYVARTGHIHSCSPLLINKAKFDELPEDLQQIMYDCAKEWGKEHTRYVAELEESQWAELENEHGMIITDPDKAPFEEAEQPVIEAAREQFGPEIIDAIIALKK